MEIFNKLKIEAEEVKKLLTESFADVEGAFDKMKKAGKNDIEGIVEWMKQAKLISSKDHEEKVRQDLSKASDKKNVSLKEFKDAVLKMVEEQKKGIEELGSTVKDHGTKIMAALEAGSSAVQGALGGTSTDDKNAKK